MIVHRPRAASCGFRVVVDGAVLHVADLAAAAAKLAYAYAEGQRCEVQARTSLTQERPLTDAEQAELLRLATGVLTSRLP